MGLMPNRRIRHALVSAAAAAALQLGVATAATPQRWDLTDLYPTSDAWEQIYRQVEARAKTLDSLKAQVSTDAAGLRQVLLAVSDAQREAGRLWAYASLQADEDIRVARGQERRQQVQALWGLITEKSAWLAPAIQALGEPKVRAWLAADATLTSRFDMQLLDTLRMTPHTLSPKAKPCWPAPGSRCRKAAPSASNWWMRNCRGRWSSCRTASASSSTPRPTRCTARAPCAVTASASSIASSVR
jgi:oligoendopeptidase F